MLVLFEVVSIVLGILFTAYGFILVMTTLVTWIATLIKGGKEDDKELEVYRERRRNRWNAMNGSTSVFRKNLNM